MMTETSLDDVHTLSCEKPWSDQGLCTQPWTPKERRFLDHAHSLVCLCQKSAEPPKGKVDFLMVIHVNTRSLLGHLDDVAAKHPHILALSETWLYTSLLMQRFIFLVAVCSGLIKIAAAVVSLCIVSTAFLVLAELWCYSYWCRVPVAFC